MKEKQVKTIAISKENLEETMKGLGLSDEEVKDMVKAIERKQKSIALLGKLMIGLFPGPEEAISGALTVACNLSALMADIDVSTNEEFISDASDLAQGLIIEQELDPHEAIALLTTTASLIASSIDEEGQKLGEIVSRNMTKDKDTKRNSAKEEMNKVVDGLFDGDITEEELAKRLAALISQTK